MEDCDPGTCALPPAPGTGYGRTALKLSYFTIIYNIIEGVLAVLSGSVAGSISLVGFGLDSFIESLSSGVVLWRFRFHRDASGADRKSVERRATRMVGVTLFILAGYVLLESVRKLAGGKVTSPTVFGVAIPVVSIIVMIYLYRRKRHIGNAMHSHSLLADSKQTLACIFLSVAVLTGFLLNYLFGFWQADPLAGMVIAVLLVREGYRAIKEEELCGC